MLSSVGEVKVHLADRSHYGTTLLLATGSKKHIDELGALARHKGFSLDRQGLSRGSTVIAGRTEEGIYKALGLAFIEPELREGGNEIERAMKGDLPRLVTDRDLRGILHAHTDLSDGVDTLETMAQAT